MKTLKYLADIGKHKYKLVDGPRKFFIDKELATVVIIDCRTTAAQKIWTRLEFKEYDIILNQKKKLVPTKIESLFEGEKMQAQ